MSHLRRAKPRHELRRIQPAGYDALNRARATFAKAWDDFNGPPATPDPWSNPRPEGWKNAVGAYHALGVSDDDIAAAVRIAFEREDVPRDAKFAYACGVLKNYASVAQAKGDARPRRTHSEARHGPALGVAVHLPSRAASGARRDDRMAG